MFDKLIRTLRELEQTKEVSVQIQSEPDADGYIEKECPAPECMFLFKVHLDDWRAIVRDEEVFCPSCGHAAKATSWWTTEQVEWAKRKVFSDIETSVDQAMEDDAREWNRRQRSNSFLTISMTYNKGSRAIVLPLAASDPMQLKVRCERCRCRFSVIGSAYFCPSCGHNAADRVFDQSLDKILATQHASGGIRAAISNRDVAENTIQLLTEGGIQNAVTAFQRFAEALWEQLPNPKKIRRNAFQNLDEGASLWAAAGKPYDLSADEMAILKKYFQQRHVLAHREGVVDDDYIARSGDSAYKVGQRLVIRDAAVRECVALIRKLGQRLKP